MSGVVWQRLVLAGFGRWQQPVELSFGDGLSVLVGANEQGKTSLIAGLTAVLFGLPASQDANAFGQARWRNWQQPPDFSGELWFMAAGLNWQLTRNFATNRVVLRQALADGWQELVAGTDNPSARRPLDSYRRQLRRLLGVDQRELFQAACCFGQPLPAPDKLDEAVQLLLSGANSRAGQAAEFLSEQAKALTKHYAQQLGGSRDGNRNRLLEQLDERINALEQELSKSRDAVDGLQSLQAELVGITQRQADLDEQLIASEAVLQAWASWRLHQERYRQAVAAEQRWQTAMERATLLQTRIAAKTAELGPLADMEPMADEWPQRLDLLQDLATAKQTAETELARVSAALGNLQADAQQTSPDAPVVNDLGSAVWGLHQRLQQEFCLFEQADASELELLAAFPHQQLSLGVALAEAERAEQELLVEMDAPAQMQLGRRGQRRQVKSTNSVWAGLALLMIVTLAFWVFGQGAGALEVAAVAAAGSVLILWLLRKSNSIQSAVAGTAGAEGQHLLRQRRTLAEVQAAKLQAELQLGAWQRQMRPFTSAYADVASAYRQWQQLRQQLADAQTLATGLRLGADQVTQSWRESSRLRLIEAEQQAQQLQSRIAALEQAQAEQLAPIAVSWHASGDLAGLRRRWQTYLTLSQELASEQRSLAELFAAFQVGSPADAESVAAAGRGEHDPSQTTNGCYLMQQRLLTLGHAALAERLRWQQLIDRHPGLPSIEQELSAAQLEQLYRQNEATVARLRQAVNQCQQEQRQALQQQAMLLGQSPCNLAQLEEQLSDLRAEREQLRREVAALGLAYRELVGAKQEYEASYRERLALQASQYFERLTGDQGRRIELGPDFTVTLLTSSGQAVSPVVLSQGARDQLYFGLRLAIADLLAARIRLPLILDDPFVNSDAGRLAQVRQMLTEVAALRQVWLVSHQTQFAEWGMPQTIVTVE